MKKICEYCKTEVEYKKENITQDEYKGRGIYCKFCGGFVEIPYKESIDVRECSTHIRSGKGIRYKRNKNRKMAVIGIFLVIFVGLSYVLFIPSQTTIPEYLPNSTFIIFDNKTKNDVSTEIKLSIYISKKDIEFERELDICLLMNFDKVIDSVYASSVMVNLIPYPYVWVEINSNNENPNYNTDYGRLVSGKNYEYTFYAYPPVNYTYLEPYL